MNECVCIYLQICEASASSLLIRSNSQNLTEKNQKLYAKPAIPFDLTFIFEGSVESLKQAICFIWLIQIVQSNEKAISILYSNRAFFPF